jgi:outer membrane protein assembly factor BamB
MRTAESAYCRRDLVIWTCATALVVALAASLKADDWPQWLGPQRDGMWGETGILEKFPKDGPKVRWRFDLSNGYAGPAVANGRVYVMDRVLAEGAKNPSNPFNRDKVAGEERVFCINDKDGKEVWRHTYPCTYDVSYPNGPRTTPVIQDGRVYTLGTMGDLYCLDEKDGKVVWSKNLVKDYGAPVSQWGFSAHPVIEGDKLICLVGGKGSEVVAFDKKTGVEKWKAMSMRNSDVGYAPPMVFSFGGKRQLVIWDPEKVSGLDPETGNVLWQTDKDTFRCKNSLTVSTPRLDKDRLLVTAFYEGSLLLQLDKNKATPTVVWKDAGRGETPEQTETLHSIMCTPYIKDGYIYGVCSYGELRCLKEADGSRVWEDLRATGSQTKPTERWANAFLTPQGDRWFLFNEKGDLIIATLSPKGYEEIDRAHLLDPTTQLQPNRKVLWSHPAYANKSIYVRNDKEIVCFSLAAE